MKYIVVVGHGSSEIEITTKKCMDDALDVIQSLEEFDRTEGLPVSIDSYRVKIVKD